MTQLDDPDRKTRLEQSAAKRKETQRRKLTFEQQTVLAFVADHREKYNDATPTLDVHHFLYDGPLNREWSRQRWSSRSEAAQPYLAALVKKGYLVRPDRGYVDITVEGRERVGAACSCGHRHAQHNVQGPDFLGSVLENCCRYATCDCRSFDG